MKNRKHRQTEDKERAYSTADFMDDLVDAFAFLPFRQRRQLKILSDRRRASLEKTLLEMAGAGLQKVLPRLGEMSKAARRNPMDAGTWRLIDQRLARLDWTRERLDQFLHSNESPVRGGIVHTCADGNLVLLALRKILMRKGSPGSDAGATDLLRAG